MGQPMLRHTLATMAARAAQPVAASLACAVRRAVPCVAASLACISLIAALMPVSGCTTLYDPALETRPYPSELGQGRVVQVIQVARPRWPEPASIPDVPAR